MIGGSYKKLSNLGNSRLMNLRDIKKFEPHRLPQLCTNMMDGKIGGISLKGK